MTQVPLDELLTDEQIEMVMVIIQRTPGRDRIAKLKEYLNQFKDELEKKGVVADYLAYAIENIMLNIQQKEANERN